MIKEILMPAGGQTTDKSTVGMWLVAQGDQVKRGDPLVEVETDKATLTVESFAEGTVLALLAESGDTRSAGETLAYIGDESDLPQVQAKLGGGEVVSEEPEAAFDDEDEYQPIDGKRAAQPKGAEEEIKAMPNAKKLAAEKQVKLSDVAVLTGRSVIKRADVQYYIDQNSILALDSGQQPDSRIPMTNMRKIIARRMLESTQSIPSFQAVAEVDMEACIAFRKAANQGNDTVKISYNDIIMKCVEAAIRKYPLMNASYSDEAILLHRDVHAGLAVSVEDGLVVPVVHKVNGKSILEISEINKINIDKARQGKLTADDMSGGTITISNLGMYPVAQFNAIINPPEVCIIALGTMIEKPVVEAGAVVVKTMMNVTGGFDHRVIDGAYGAAFLTELKKIMENPALALL